MSNPIRVVLADDHAVVRKGIREFLEDAGDITVVAEAADGEVALSAIREHKPDVAVLDIQMPRRTGIEVTRAVRDARLPVGVLVLTAYDDDPYVQAMLEAGANARHFCAFGHAEQAAVDFALFGADLWGNPCFPPGSGL